MRQLEIGKGRGKRQERDEVAGGSVNPVCANVLLEVCVSCRVRASLCEHVHVRHAQLLHYR